ncbi:MAG: hypothetical protein P8M30_14055 [Planctomycetaceae bacterium]|nr:hypothetical protein [bacterium]MDG2390427.1 hypothetical protein [Planctomycetaceae bacterium]
MNDPVERGSQVGVLQTGPDLFDGHIPTERNLFREMHLSHASFAEKFNRAVVDSLPVSL